MSEKKLLDRVRDTLRRKNYAYRTEQAYTSWIKRYIFYHHKRHPEEMREHDIEAFLTYLVVEAKVSPSTQNQALAALQFLYNEVLHLPLNQDILPVPAKRTKHLPVVLSKGETQAVLRDLHGVYLIIAQLLYGSGLRVKECLTLRIHDLDFERNEITVRSGKGAKDRRTILPDSISSDLNNHLKRVRQTFQQDIKDGYGSVYLPRALSRKYPHAARKWIWQYVFPAPNLSRDPRSGIIRRHHLHPSNLRRVVRVAARKAGVDKHVNPHLLAQFRHPFAGKWLRHPHRAGTARSF